MDYYLSRVANSVDDYYLGSGEAPGRWLGEPAKVLGLEGEVGPEDLRMIFGGYDSEGNDLLSKYSRQPGRRPGFDLTFSAPKGVSLLWAFGDVDLKASIMRAHDEAVASTMDFVSKEACFVRRGSGSGGQREIIEAQGFVAAVFRHRTSRAGDPQLHSHVLVPNVVLGPDRRWSAPDGRHIYSWAKTAGTIYQSALRSHLAQSGVRFDVRTNGLCEVAGIDEKILRGFSKRRDEIETRLEARGEASAKSAEKAALDTRKAKAKGPQGAPGADELAKGWTSELGQIQVPDGKGAKRPATKADILGALGSPFDTTPTSAQIEKAFEILVGAKATEPFLGEDPDQDGPKDGSVPTNLTERASTFSRKDAIGELAKIFTMNPTQLTKLAARLLAHPDIVRVTAHYLTKGEAIRTRDGRIVRATSGDRRYSTVHMIELEKALIELCEQGVGQSTISVSRAVIDQVLANNWLLDKQQSRAVRAICGSKNTVDLLIGEAGTGKTFVFDAMRQAYNAQGYKVIGTALSARAARELQSKTAIGSMTIHRLYSRLSKGRLTLDNSTVLVVDEAAMVGTRALDWIIGEANKAGAKVVLAGDDRQLPSIDAGGVITHLASKLSPSRLTINRRQSSPEQSWERQALTNIRQGKIRPALEAYKQKDHLRLYESGQSAREALLADWSTLSKDGLTLVLAVRNREVKELNLLIHDFRLQAGEIRGPETTLPNGYSYCIGDRVLFTNNDYDLGVLNGEFATILGIGDQDDPLALKVKVDGHPNEVVLPSDYTTRYTQLGYCTTVYRAQGATLDHCLVFCGDGLFQEAGYTSLSRGKHSNIIYGLTPESPRWDIGHGNDGTVQIDPLESLVWSLSNSHKQVMALDYLADYSKVPGARELTQLYERKDELVEELSPQIEASKQERQLKQQLNRWLELARDHEIIGTYNSGSEVDYVNERVALKISSLQEQLREAQQNSKESREFLENHQDKLAELTHLTKCISRGERALGQVAIYEMPKWATGALGELPTTESLANSWEATAGKIGGYLRRFGHDRLPAKPPTDPQEASHYQSAIGARDNYRQQFNNYSSNEFAQLETRGVDPYQPEPTPAVSMPLRAHRDLEIPPRESLWELTNGEKRATQVADKLMAQKSFSLSGLVEELGISRTQAMYDYLVGTTKVLLVERGGNIGAPKNLDELAQDALGLSTHGVSTTNGAKIALMLAFIQWPELYYTRSTTQHHNLLRIVCKKASEIEEARQQQIEAPSPVYRPDPPKFGIGF